MELPEVNKRVQYLIDTYGDRNETKFAKLIGFKGPQKINRLFKIYKKSGEYPMPSIEILLAITKTFDIDLNWLVFGKETEKSNILKEPAPEYLNGSSKNFRKLEKIIIKEHLEIKKKLEQNILQYAEILEQLKDLNNKCGEFSAHK